MSQSSEGSTDRKHTKDSILNTWAIQLANVAAITQYEAKQFLFSFWGSVEKYTASTKPTEGKIGNIFNNKCWRCQGTGEIDSEGHLPVR